MKLNKLLLGTALAMPLFLTSCKNDTYIEVFVDAPNASILNCGYNTVELKISDEDINKGVKFADTLNASDFEFTGEKLTGKKFEKNTKDQRFNS